jgi:hypothetical protein
VECCSETIGLIAGALATAQIELTNPEKSLGHSVSLPARRRPQLSLCVLIQRVRSCSQVTGATRDCNGPDDLD